MLNKIINALFGKKPKLHEVRIFNQRFRHVRTGALDQVGNVRIQVEEYVIEGAVPEEKNNGS